MRKLLSGGLVLFGAVSLPIPLTPRTVPQPPAHEYRSDPRFTPLHNFFRKTDCPAAEYAAEFLLVADEFALDWRLLPSLSFVETTGGKASFNNNLFGWNSGRAHFSTPRASIHAVGLSLGRSALYRSKSVDQILHLYNPRREYAQKVESVMRQIAAVQ